MRFAPIVALAAGAVLLVPGAPRTDGGEPKRDVDRAAPATSQSSPRLPFNPFADARKGDWSVVYEATKARAGTGYKSLLTCFGTQIDSVDGHDVKLSKVWKDLNGEVHTRIFKFSNDEAPTVAQLAAIVGHGDSKLKNVTIEDDKQKLEHHEFLCKKISFEVDMTDHTAKVSIWISPDVNSGALVATRTEIRGEVMRGRPEGFKTHISIMHVLAGHGRDIALGWGKRIENVLEELKEWSADRSKVPAGLRFEDDPKVEEKPRNIEGAAAVGSASCPRLPFNPFAGAEKGAWSVVYTTLRVRTEAQTGTLLSYYSTIVEEVDGDTVMLMKVWKDGDTGNVLGQHFTFSKREAPTIDEFLMIAGVPGPATKDVKLEDEKRTAGGKEWSCKKVSFKTEKDGRTFTICAWLSPDVKGGIVGLTTEHDGKVGIGEGNRVQATLSSKNVLGGYGGAGKLNWGISPSVATEQSNAWYKDPTAVPKELLIEDKAEPAKEEPPKPK